MDIIMKTVMLVYEIRQRHPELRLCQILSNAARKAGWDNNDLFYLPDDKLLYGLEILKEENSLNFINNIEKHLDKTIDL